MTKDELKLVLEALKWCHGGEPCGTAEAIAVVEKALAQEQEQVPVAWPCLIAEADFSENTVILAMQCTDYKVSAGNHWLSNTPPQRTERPADCERCNRLEEQAYELLGKLRVANIKLSMQPQRTWVGLTDEKRSQLVTLHHGWNEYGQAIEAKLKQQNGYAEENT